MATATLDRPRPRARYGRMHRFSKHGDTIIRWQHDDPKSTERARQEFETWRQTRCTFFGRRARARQTTPIHEFDPNLVEILVVPPIAGG